VCTHCVQQPVPGLSGLYRWYANYYSAGSLNLMSQGICLHSMCVYGNAPQGWQAQISCKDSLT
jgi:hypothetical protein